jgi:hypothetical protein
MLFAPLPAPMIVDGVVINHLGVDIITDREIAYPRWYRASKRQAGRRDLRRHGVRNAGT